MKAEACAFDVSVVICTHNPRKDYIARVLDALKQQSLAPEKWELLIIDNASEPALEALLDLSWKPTARIVREMELGLTPARLRGFADAVAPLIVFVDDYNVLDPDYLEMALSIFQENAHLGALGGSAIAEFETEPPAWSQPYLKELCIRRVDRRETSVTPGDMSVLPSGAGLCIRAEVGRKYAEIVGNDPLRRRLGRRGASLVSGEDVDLVLTSLAMGFGVCLAPELSLIHLISRQRYTFSYLTRMVYGKNFSYVFLAHLCGRSVRSFRIDQVVRAFGRLLLTSGYKHARITCAGMIGHRRAARMLRQSADLSSVSI